LPRPEKEWWGFKPAGMHACKWIRDRYHSKGPKSLLLKWHIHSLAKGYSRLTVRMLYYLLCSRCGYSPGKNFYKKVVYHSTIMRRVDEALAKKFRDPTREFTLPPFAFKKAVVFVEKDSIKHFIADIAARYRLPIQVLRGYGSLTCFQKALARAKKKGVQVILYLGDLDESGIDIQRCMEKEMDSGLGAQVIRLAITWAQVAKYKPPSKPVNKKDSRAKKFIEKFGNRGYEIESLRPRTLRRIVEEGFKKYLPKDFLEAAQKMETAVKAVRPITERFRRIVEKEAFKLVKLDWSPEDIARTLSVKYGLRKT